MSLDALSIYIAPVAMLAAGTHVLRAMVPAGSTLVSVSARNQTTGWRMIELRLAGVSNPDEDPRGPILVRAVQDGVIGAVSWVGHIKASGSYRSVTAVFEDGSAGDFVTMTLGVET